MVGPLLIMKMLHCRKLNNKPKSCDNQEVPSGKQKSRDNKCNVNVLKIETNDELCRVCLKQGTIPIHADNPCDDLTEAISIFGGIEINIFDTYPKYLCQSCHALLQGAILFKKTAQESDERLKTAAEPEFDADNFSEFGQDNDYDSTSIENREACISCKRCDIKFNSYEEYDKHRLSDEHENFKKTCPICNKEYSIGYFRTHMELHKQETAYVCDVCGKHFSLQHRFKRHRVTHFYSLPFKCSLCPYKGRFNESLKMHMRSHTGEKPYICEECPLRFINKSNLSKHMKTHKKERDFVCECGRGYYTKREFEMHFKVEHAGIKEHVCQMCGKAFGYRKHLMRHQLKVHKREKLRSGRMPIYLKAESLLQQTNMPAT